MAWVVAAVAGSAILGAGTSLYASSKQSESANNALQYQQSVDAQNQRNYLQAQGNIRPFIQAGQGAVDKLNQSYADPGSFTSQPDYQFGQREGMDALQNSAAAKGGMLSGNFLRRADQFGQDYGMNYLTNYRQGLQGVANMGSGAALGAAGATSNNANSSNSAAGQIGGTMNYLGGAQASGMVGAANSANSGIQNYLLSNALNRSSYGGVGGMPATGSGSPSDFTSNTYAMSQGINPF